jgi:hypothetical protein
LTVFVTDTTAPFLQQGRGLLIITIIDINEQPPVSFTSYFMISQPKSLKLLPKKKLRRQKLKEIFNMPLHGTLLSEK